MDVAIQVRKIAISDEREIFIPVGIIKGTFDEEKETFVDEYKKNYYLMEGSIFFGDHYFTCPISMEILRKSFPPNITDKDILINFSENFRDKCYISFYNILEQNRLIQEIDLA